MGQIQRYFRKSFDYEGRFHPSRPAQMVEKVLKLESEAATGGVKLKNVFWKISQNSQEKPVMTSL